MPVNELPRYRRGKTTYFWDERLKQLRNVDQPSDFIDAGSWGYTLKGDLEVYIRGEGWTQFAKV